LPDKGCKLKGRDAVVMKDTPRPRGLGHRVAYMINIEDKKKRRGEMDSHDSTVAMLALDSFGRMDWMRQ